MFSGNSRFKLLRQLGAGGMGVVYEALDQQRNARVALKTLRETDAHMLYRLKREFRSLRDLVHRNLVGLDELFEEGGHWFFTMELLEGEDLHMHLHGAARRPPADPGAAAVWEGATLADSVASDPQAAAVTWSRSMIPDPEHARALRAIDFERIRDVFRQIAEGLIAVHEAGKIHRDIKPSNIIVSGERVVILDFGLVTEQWGASRSGKGEVVGTLMYMAPEQATAQAVGPAADWYSVGVMLYESLTLQRPFAGAWGGLLAAEQQVSPPDPREINAACPADLAELCVALLHSDPSRRPEGPEALSRLHAGTGTGAGDASARGAPSPAPVRVFVGREGELRELRRAFEGVGRGASITVFVHGESGIGKSTLLQCFASAAEAEDSGTVVLAGQCREHEALPFKGVDGIIDALAHHVCRLSDAAAAELVPRDAALLPGVFPVLGRIPAIASAPRSSHIADPFQQRKRVFTALREMLCRLTARSRLICLIDDMQWVDSDSLHLLEELLRPPDQPRMLLLASVRSGEAAPALPAVPGEVRRIRLERLNHEESLRLIELMLDRIAPEQALQTARIVDETGGHPLFIGELVRYAATDPRAVLRPLRLDEAIWARVSQLEATPLEVLKLLATAVAPLSEAVIQAAAALDGGALQRCIALLRASYLARVASATHGLLEVYHDRVRQSVVHHIDEAERVALNERLAAALEAAGEQSQPELLIHHLEGARQLERAARKAVEAAERAQSGLAFEQAIALYEAALRLAAWSAGERREILIKLGGALASAGRGPAAAAAYARAAEGADPQTELACRIQEADQLLQSGHLERGTELMSSLFRERGQDVSDTRSLLILRIAWHRFRIALHGLRWTDRQKHEIGPAGQALLSLYKAASRGFILVDPVRASYFVSRGLQLAMKLGDRDFVVYCLFIESGFRGGEGLDKHEAFIRDADRIMTHHLDPLFQSTYRMLLGVRMYLAVDRAFQEAFEVLDRSDDALAQAPNAAWELSAGRFFLVCSLHKLGDFPRLRTYADRFVREAEQRGNLLTRTSISRLRNTLWLVDDDPAGARADLETDSWAPYTTCEYHMQHWLELRARIEIAIYEGSPIDPQLLAGHFAGLRRSFLERVTEYRCETAWMVGRLALAEAGPAPARRRTVRRSAARLAACNTHYTRMLARMLLATLAVQEGNREAAAAGFREVVELADAAGIAFIAAAARRRLGALVGGDEGRALVAAAEQWMREVGIKDLARMTHLASPCDLEP